MVEYLFMMAIRVIARGDRMTEFIYRIRTTAYMSKKMHSTFTPFITGWIFIPIYEINSFEESWSFLKYPCRVIIRF
jgi:hypothetical protein